MMCAENVLISNKKLQLSYKVSLRVSNSRGQKT